MRYVFTRHGNDRGWIESWDGIVVAASVNFIWALHESVVVVLHWAEGKFGSRVEENKVYVVHDEDEFQRARLQKQAAKNEEMRKRYGR